MESNIFINIVSLLVIAVAATIPAWVVFSMMRPTTKKRHINTNGMDLNIRGVKLPKDKKKKKCNLGSSAGRW